MGSRLRGPAGLVAALAIAGGVWSCGGPGNSGQSAPDPSVVRAVPWLNGVLPAVAGGQAIVPDTPTYPPIAMGLPDPGSRPPNCSGLAAVELSPFWIDTFEPDMSGNVGVAKAWAGYDDLTKYAFHAPGDATWYPGLNNPTKKFGAPWGLPAEQVDGLPSCDGLPNHWALHLRGGLFRNWGGGASHIFTDPDGCPTGADFCPPPVPDGATVDSAGLPLTAPDSSCSTGPTQHNCLYDESHAFVDASKYDGVAFWARRGPESQDRLLVTITDNFTSDRLARQNQRFCRRVRQCYTHCLSGTPCSPTAEANPNGPGVIYRCFDSQAGPLPSIQNGGAPTSQLDLMYPRCGQSACTFPTTYPDADFEGKACRPYTFPAAEAYVAGEFCFNEGDPPPPSRDDRCLNGWVRTVQLTSDWQFYTVPFSEFRQGDFGKIAPYFNLKAIDLVALGFIVGWADVFVDNVSFYRRKR